MPALQRRSARKTRKPRRHLSAPSPVDRVTAASATSPRTPRPVLLATDGSRLASAAIKMARRMATLGEWAPELLTVLEPLPVSVGDMVLPAPPAQYQIVAGDSIVAAIKRQLRTHGDSSWKLTTDFGRAVPAIVRAAHEMNAQLIVLGLGQHGRFARLFGAETAARVARHTDIPILAVHARARGLPNVALAAVDFSDSSVRAAREALALLEPPGRLHLVHVKWSYNMTSLANSEWERAYAVGVEDEFARLRAKLGERRGIEITTALLTGGVIEHVLDEAKSIKSDLIALGSHSQNVFDRLMIGSTPAQVLRAAPCSVLVAPPADAPAWRP